MVIRFSTEIYSQAPWSSYADAPRRVSVCTIQFQAWKHCNNTHTRIPGTFRRKGRRAYPVIHSQAPCYHLQIYLFICLCRGFSCLFSDNAWHVLNWCQQAWNRTCSRWFMRIWCCSAKDTGSEDIKDLQSLELFTKVSILNIIWTHLSDRFAGARGLSTGFRVCG